VKNNNSQSLTAGKKTLFLLLCSLALFLGFLAVFWEQGSGPEALGGHLDLSGTSFKDRQIYKLAGQWHLYTEKFIDPDIKEGEDKPPLIQEVPGTWNKAYQPRGFATYRLTVELPRLENDAALIMPALSTAYRLYINGERRGSNGNPSSTADRSVPEYRYSVFEIDETTENLEILIHVSNHEYARGGMWYTPLIGDKEEVTDYFRRRIFTETLIAGGIILVGIILLALFTVRREFLSYANLGLFCLAMGTRTLVVGEIPITYFFDDFNWRLIVHMEYLSMSLGFFFINSYFYNIYKRFYNRRILLLLNGTAILFSLFVILSPIRMFTEQILIAQLLVLAGVANTVYLFIKSGRKMKEENTLLITGISLFLFTVVLDILMANNKMMFLPFEINTSYGLILHILVNSLILVRQAARLTGKLQSLTNNLEEQVRARTSELERVNRKLSEQAVTDLLTGVSNRHEFSNVMKTEEARFLRSGNNYAGLYLDLDNFKYINDNFGHPAGDLILKRFAHMLKSIIRDSDYLFRLGGDEFFILMTDVPSEKEGEKLAERILEETKKWNGFKKDLEEFLGGRISIPEEKSFSLSIGIGSTDYPGVETLHALPALSDKALLRAKAEGKNRFALYTDKDKNNS